LNFEGTTPGFDGWYEGMYKNYFDNINIDDKGGVVASPDPNTPGGSYEYHWMRDAALTMRAFMEIHDFDLDEI
jgi:glucoamylase